MKDLKAFINKDIIKKMKHNASLVGPGDDLQDGDVVLFGYQYSYDKSYAYTNLGIYNAKTGDIEYDDGTHGPWKNLKDDFQYFVRGMVYIKHVLKIWRPINDSWIRYPENLEDIKAIERNKNYVRIYENKELMKRFGL